MPSFEIVAHRGITTSAPENTLAAFEQAIQLGADVVEIDVRLTADHIPVVYHYYYLNENTSATGPIFTYSLEQLRQVEVFARDQSGVKSARISTLAEVLDAIGGRIQLEIEIKGPEPEAPYLIGAVLDQFKPLWEGMEITSFEPALLLAMQQVCPGLTMDLLLPRSEPWMGLDVIAYQALHRARLAHARAVHLHPTQISSGVVEALTQQGLQIHAWEVNSVEALAAMQTLNIPRLCTDDFQQAYQFRSRGTEQGE